MKQIPLLLFSLVLAVSAHASGYAFTETFSETHPLRAGGTLSLANVNGSVEVRTWDRPEIRIEGEKSARTDEELKLIQLTIEPQPDRVAVEVKLPKRRGAWFGVGDSEIRASVRFTITVPVEAGLDEVRTVNGSVAIDGVRGSVRAGSVNGRVKAIGLAADARLTTTNGAIEARVSQLGAGNKLEFRSTNGGITLELPKDAGAELNASVVNGHVECDVPIQLSGRVSGRRVRGTIGAGGAEIKAYTVNGSMRIRTP